MNCRSTPRRLSRAFAIFPRSGWNQFAQPRRNTGPRSTTIFWPPPSGRPNNGVRHRPSLPARTYITVPINLRTPEDRTMSNILSSVTVSLTPEAMGGKEALLPLIREQMNALDKNGIARTMLNLSCLLKPVPLAFKRYLLKSDLFPDLLPRSCSATWACFLPIPHTKTNRDSTTWTCANCQHICDTQCSQSAGPACLHLQ